MSAGPSTDWELLASEMSYAKARRLSPFMVSEIPSMYNEDHTEVYIRSLDIAFSPDDGATIRACLKRLAERLRGKEDATRTFWARADQAFCTQLLRAIDPVAEEQRDSVVRGTAP